MVYVVGVSAHYFLLCVEERYIDGGNHIIDYLHNIEDSVYIGIYIIILMVALAVR